MTLPSPDVEAARLAALRAYDILDTPAEPSFDRLTTLATTLFDVPIALVSLVDTHRQWFKSCVGMSGSGTSRDVAFCSHAILQPEVLVIPDARLDVRFADNPFVVGEPFVRFYAGAPLRTPSGHNVGTLCIIDYAPRDFDARARRLLADLAALVVDELEARLGARARFLLDKVAATTPNYLYVVAIEGRQIVWSNRDLAQSLGYTEDAQRSVQFRTEITHPDDRPVTAGRFARFAELADGEQLETSYRMRHADGDYRWFLTRESVFERDGGGRVTQIVGVSTEVTRMKAVERQLTENVTALESARAELGRLALTDEMTGLPNLRAFRERLGQLVLEAERGRPFALVMLDVDHFKKVNDTHGHHVGDEVLVAIARTLKAHVRRVDLVARYGGEEFCVLYSGCAPDDAARLTEALRVAIAGAPTPIPVTASFGLCVHAGGRPGRDGERMLHDADEALYRAKREGRNRVALAR